MLSSTCVLCVCASRAYDAAAEEDAYWEERIYCREVRRVGVSCLMHFEHPRDTAMIFTKCVLVPWRSYLARYPEVQLVIVIGDASEGRKMYQPTPHEPKEVPGLTLRQTMPIDCERGAPLTMCVYERAGK